MKIIVGVADMKISAGRDDVLVTHALGSCLGVAAYDGHVAVGGMLHVMLPQSSMNPDKARTNPYMFVDTGLTAFFRELYGAGAAKGRLEVKVAGGASINCEGVDRFAIGKRNCVMLKKLLWQNGVLISAEDIGGTCPRTMYMEIGTGRTWLSTSGQEKEL